MTISVSDCAKYDMVKYAKGIPEKFKTIYLAYNKRFSVIKDQAISKKCYKRKI